MTHNEAVELLPWYLNGTLVEAERDAVHAHLVGCQVCASEMEELKLLQREVGELPAAAPEPSSMRVKAVINRATADRTRRARARNWLGWWSPLPMGARLAIAAQFILLLGLGLFLAAGPRGAFTTLTGSGNGDGARIVVGFQPDITEATLRATVQELKGTIIAGPSALGLYTIAVPVEPERDEEIEALLERLRRNDGVIRIAELAP